MAGNITASPINAIGSAADVEPGNALPNSIYLGLDVRSTKASEAVANNQYFQFSIMPDPGHALDLEALKFTAGRGGVSGPRGWVVRSSADGFAADLGTHDVSTIQPTLTAYDVDLSGPQFQNRTSPTTFRIYGYAPTAPNIGVFFDDIDLLGRGVAASIPEPGSLLLAAGAAASIVAATRRQFKRRAKVDARIALAASASR